VDQVSGPTCRSAGLLSGRVHLTGTSETLVGGDPWVPMSIRRSLAMVRVVIASVDVVSRLAVALVCIPIQQSEG
jgi:hypothetical protein